MASSWVFKSSAESDATWEGLLPPDYEDIPSKVPPVAFFRSKKEIYDHLSNGVPIGCGNTFFSLEKSTGKKCYMLGARHCMGSRPEVLDGNSYQNQGDQFRLRWFGVENRMGVNFTPRFDFIGI
ncbi:PREDICTED: putative F-box protein PP2-B2 [Nelumbo nucifera]|uniref:Uncharacterized protein n=2 Tax=Nelumbo nucifera TaxID=4432 RepID=A0A822Y8W8_NELNU|nr:PREDICTED: putative F-box protein PP2-B2 [Nelumbo nucifera]DAD28513.1 TPA_asm: hypothetical protein HUJ06_029981 [Nelumbo nucifera]